MFAKITYKLTDLWIKGFTKIKVIGPLAPDSGDYQRVIHFRTMQNKLRAPYLEEKHQVDIETSLQIDARSLHFALEREGAIVACVRLTPLPFELSALAKEFDTRSLKYHDYFEFGRLCTDANLDRKGFHAGVLVVKAAQHVFMKEKAKGFIGICKTNLVPYMRKLGLQIDPRAVILSERKGEYHLIHASKEELISYYFNRFFGFFMNLFVKKAPEQIVYVAPTPQTAEKNHESRPSERPSRSRIWQAS